VSRRSVLRVVDPADEPTFVFSPDGQTVATAVAVADYGTTPEEWLNDHFGVPVLPRHRLKVQLFDAETGSERAAWTVSGYFGGSLLGFAADCRRVWTETHISDPANAAGMRAVELWDETTGRPPVWLFGATAVGLLLVVADWRRGRRQKESKLQPT
jgi:hypothetical protein